MQIIYKLIINVSIIIIIGMMSAYITKSQGTYTVGGKFTAEQTTDIVTGDLREQGLEHIHYYLSLAKDGSSEELSKHFAARQGIRNPSDPNDLAEYVVPVTNVTDEELLAEQTEFFLNLERDCGDKSKVYVGDMSGDGEPIGHAFRLTIPGKIQGDDVACYHYTVSFRRTLEGKLLITEWYAMPGNMDCQ